MPCIHSRILDRELQVHLNMQSDMGLLKKRDPSDPRGSFQAYGPTTNGPCWSPAATPAYEGNADTVHHPPISTGAGATNTVADSGSPACRAREHWAAADAAGPRRLRGTTQIGRTRAPAKSSACGA